MKIRPSKKNPLSLHRETLRRLDADALADVHGGISNTIKISVIPHVRDDDGGGGGPSNPPPCSH